MKVYPLILVALISLGASARKFEYHHASPLALGLGVNLADPSEPQRMCLDFEEERMDGEVARRSEINIKVVESRRELFRELGFSSSIAAQSYFVSGDAGGSYLDEANFQEDSLVWLVIGSVDFGRIRTKNTALKPFAAQLLSEGKHEEFARQCGMHHVSQERRGASVFALYTLKNLERKEKQDIKAWLNAHTSNVPFVDVQTENKFSLALSEFARNKQLSFRVLALGGKGITALAHIPKFDNDVGKIKETISEYLLGLTDKNAVPLEFITSTFEQFGWKSDVQFNWDKRDVVLAEYYFAVSQIDSERKLLRKIIDARQEVYPHLSQDEIANYFELLRERNVIWQRLHAEAERCVQDPKQCSPAQYDLRMITWPLKAHEIYRSSRVWSLHSRQKDDKYEPAFAREQCNRFIEFALRIGCIRREEIRDLQYTNSAPMCDPDGNLESIAYCKP